MCLLIPWKEIEPEFIILIYPHTMQLRKDLVILLQVLITKNLQIPGIGGEPIHSYFKPTKDRPHLTWSPITGDQI